MTRFGKFTATSLIAVVLSSACAPKRGTASPEDYYAAAQLTLEGGRVAAMIGRNQAIAEKNFVACVVSDVLASALASGEQALRGKLADTPVIPAFDLDLSDCMAIRGEGSVPSSEEVAALIEGIAGVALAASQHYAEKLKSADCRKGVAVLAVRDYIAGLLNPVVSELTEPDGELSVGAVEIDLASCKAS